jgi:hypothetical protein
VVIPARPGKAKVESMVQVTQRRHPYSVPYQLLGEELEARFTRTMVEVYYKGRRIVSHPRRYDGRPSTLAEHMPSAHRAHAEWTPSRLINWAKKTGPATGRVVAGILASRPHPEHGYHACLGADAAGQALRGAAPGGRLRARRTPPLLQLHPSRTSLAREQKRLTARLHAAKLRYPASLEDIAFKHPRGLDRQVVLSLANCGFVQNRHNLVITGPPASASPISPAPSWSAPLDRWCTRVMRSRLEPMRKVARMLRAHRTLILEAQLREALAARTKLKSLVPLAHVQRVT